MFSASSYSESTHTVAQARSEDFSLLARKPTVRALDAATALLEIADWPKKGAPRGSSYVYSCLGLNQPP